MNTQTKTLHRSETRGQADHGWLHSRHTFSFAGYYEPSRMNFGLLRVLNDDSVAAAEGFDTHPHKDMEIVSIPLSGSLKHNDSAGNSHVIQAGEVQIMSAGTGIAHSEYNASDKDDVKFLQIWVFPKKLGIEPRYEQKRFDPSGRQNQFQLLVSPTGGNGSLTINQDAFFSRVDLRGGKPVTYRRHLEGNGLYLFVLRGNVTVGGEVLKERDALGLTDLDEITVQSDDAELLLIEVPMQKS